MWSWSRNILGICSTKVDQRTAFQSALRRLFHGSIHMPYFTLISLVQKIARWRRNKDFRSSPQTTGRNGLNIQQWYMNMRGIMSRSDLVILYIYSHLFTAFPSLKFLRKSDTLRLCNRSLPISVLHCAPRTSLQECHPALDLSLSTVRHYVDFGRLLSLFDLKPMSGLLMQMSPRNRHLLLLTSSLNLSTLTLFEKPYITYLALPFKDVRAKFFHAIDFF